MKKILCALSVLISTQAMSATDFNCQTDCLNRGYQYNYCTQQCSYDDGLDLYNNNNDNSFNTQKQIDYACQTDCLNSGSMLNFCNQICSF